LQAVTIYHKLVTALCFYMINNIRVKQMNIKLTKLYLWTKFYKKPVCIDFTHDDVPQDFICLTGVNGSGKTTILQVINSFLLHLKYGEELNTFRYLNMLSTMPKVVDAAKLELQIDDELVTISYSSGEKISIDRTRQVAIISVLDNNNDTEEWVGIDACYQHIFEILDYKKHCRNISTWSAGEQWIAKIFYLMDNFDKTLDSKILLIDVIERDVHPSLQVTLLYFIKKLAISRGYSQVIITSNSRKIWNQFDTQGLIDMTSSVL